MGNHLPRLKVHAAENDSSSSSSSAGGSFNWKDYLPTSLGGSSSSETESQAPIVNAAPSLVEVASSSTSSGDHLTNVSGDFAGNTGAIKSITTDTPDDFTTSISAPPKELTEDPRRIYSTLPNFPGSWNDLHKAKELFPMAFDGIRVTLNKGLSNNFQVSHNFLLGTVQPSRYRFGATYAGTKQLSQTETFPILTGEMDPSGNLSAQCIHAFSRNTRSRLVAQHQGGSFAALEIGTDYRGPSCTLSATAGNPDLLAGTGFYVASCLFPVRPNLAVGAEAVFQRKMDPQFGRMIADMRGSLAAKYNGENWSACAQISPLEMGAHLSYHHQLTENQAIGVELEGSMASGECSTTAGYSFDIPGAECAVKASIDTNWNVATTIEKKLTPLPMTLTICCQGNQSKAQYFAGIGLTTG